MKNRNDDDDDDKQPTKTNTQPKPKLKSPLRSRRQTKPSEFALPYLKEASKGKMAKFRHLHNPLRTKSQHSNSIHLGHNKRSFSVSKQRSTGDGIRLPLISKNFRKNDQNRKRNLSCSLTGNEYKIERRLNQSVDFQQLRINKRKKTLGSNLSLELKHKLRGTKKLTKSLLRHGKQDQTTIMFKEAKQHDIKVISVPQMLNNPVYFKIDLRNFFYKKTQSRASRGYRELFEELYIACRRKDGRFDPINLESKTKKMSQKQGQKPIIFIDLNRSLVNLSLTSDHTKGDFEYQLPESDTVYYVTPPIFNVIGGCEIQIFLFGISQKNSKKFHGFCFFQFPRSSYI